MSNTTPETMAFFRHQASSGSTAWGGLCLKLQRIARDIGPMYPSAISAAYATPKEDRVYDISDVRRGMVAYFDDPHDSNPYGHIVGVAGRNSDGELLTWTNDAAGHGRVSLVRASFFPNYWGDSFLFAATSLNGQDLDLPDVKKPAKPKPKPADLGAHYKHAIHELDKVIAEQKKANHPVLVKALQRDRQHMLALYKKYDGGK